MLTDKQVFWTDSDARLIFLLDTDSLGGNAEVADPLQQRATQLLLKYRNAPQTCFAQLASDPSLLIPGISSLELRKNDQGISSFHCDWDKESSSEWLLQTSAVSLQERLLSEKAQLWTALPVSERTRLATLTIAAVNMGDPPRKSGHDNASLQCLLVTRNPQLLDQQLQLQKTANNAVLRIVTPVEAARILDLWLKLHDRYLLKPDFSCGDYDWYQTASISDVPRANGEDALPRSLRRRTASIRYGVDALGEAYYAHGTGDALVLQEYHFMSVTLMLTAMLDSLAVLVNRKLPTGGDKDHQVNLSPPHTQDVAVRWPFCERVRESCPEVSVVWTKARPFLVLLYHVMRNPMAHQAMPQHYAHYFGRQSEGQSGGTMGVPSMNDGINLTELRAMCDEAPLLYEHYTNLGFSRQDFHELFGDVQQFEPYLFCREAWSRCKVLINATLELLGYPDVLASTITGTRSPEERAAMFRHTALDGLDLTTSEYSETGTDRRS